MKLSKGRLCKFLFYLLFEVNELDLYLFVYIPLFPKRSASQCYNVTLRRTLVDAKVLLSISDSQLAYAIQVVAFRQSMLSLRWVLVHRAHICALLRYLLLLLAVINLICFGGLVLLLLLLFGS